jgi:hypothetical protein
MAALHQVARQLVVPGAARLIQRSKGLVDQEEVHERNFFSTE